LINTFNPTKGIVFNKCGNTISKWIKIFQVMENKPQQILILPTTTIKWIQKKWHCMAIKHVFVWRTIYKQRVANMSVRISRKENVMVFVENWLDRFIRPKMQILRAKLSIKHFGSMYRNFCFMPNLIQIIINIVILGCRLNINLELCKTFL
jgi:hypothetical protein